jgi:phage-related tail fiber protein
LVRNQTTTTQNGIYIVSAGAWARSTDANTWDKMAGAIIPVMQGSTRSGYIYVCTSIPGASTIDVGSFSFTSKYLSTTGGILTGILTLSGDPSSALDAAPKQYVDNKYYSVTNKQPALVATTANITLSGLQTIDGITLVANDRVLVKDQTTASQNGIYFASSGLWGREADAVDWSTIYNTVITIKSGTVNAGTMWYSTATASGILGTTSLNFARANKYAAGTGISINETTKAISISATGITAGTYNGITFGTDGRATAATALNYSDLANKPTSIDEFGLTNNYTVNKIGYATGAGGSVTQTTSKSTGVTLDKMCGSIVMNSAALAANATASFTFTNANIAAGDCVLVWHAQGGTAGAYRVDTYGIAVGSCTVRVQNVSAGSLSEIFTVRFMIFRAITS